MQLSLRACTKNDTAMLYAWRHESSSQRFNPLDVLTQDQLRDRIIDAPCNLVEPTNQEVRWMVELDAHPIGSVSCKNMNHRMGYCEIGYGIGEAYQRQGYGTQAVHLLVTKIFSESPMRRMMAYVATDNTASWRILEKIGFVREGLLRQHFIINGTLHDEYLYALLRSDVALA